MRRFRCEALGARPPGVSAALAAAVMILLCAPPAHGQTSVGVLLGLSSSSLGGDAPDRGTFTAKGGLVVGLSGELHIGDGLWLIAQPQYVGRGTGVAFAVRGEEEPRDSLALSLDYVSVPVGLKVVTRNGLFYVSSVLDFGFLTGATLSNGSADRDVSTAVKDIDLAVGLGIGTGFSLGSPYMTVELRYVQSILNLPEEDASIDDDDFPKRFRASGLQIVAGLHLGGGR